jgi:hypothetical protein
MFAGREILAWINPNSGVTYLAISLKSTTTWFHPVSDEEYKNIKNPQSVPKIWNSN